MKSTLRATRADRAMTAETCSDGGELKNSATAPRRFLKPLTTLQTFSKAHYYHISSIKLVFIPGIKWHYYQKFRALMHLIPKSKSVYRIFLPEPSRGGEEKIYEFC